jgi:hypothetical protein
MFSVFLCLFGRLRVSAMFDRTWNDKICCRGEHVKPLRWRRVSLNGREGRLSESSSLPDTEQQWGLTLRNATSSNEVRAPKCATSTSCSMFPVILVFFVMSFIVQESQNRLLADSPCATGVPLTADSDMPWKHPEYEGEFPPFVCPCQNGTTTSTSASSSSSFVWRAAPRNWTQPKVVILAGPHKTGSTSAQECMVDWTATHEYMPLWSWPAPSDDDLVAANMRPFAPSKNFAPFFGVLSEQPSFVVNENFHEFNRCKMFDLYRSRMLEAWEDGKNIVYGSEEMDWMVSDTHPKSVTEEIRRGALEILPWRSHQHGRRLASEDIEVVINYRSPRYDHLLSVWKEIMAGEEFAANNTNIALEERMIHQRASEQTFRDFLSGSGRVYYFIANSLLLAHRFLEVGIKTTVVDLSGVVSKGQSTLCHAVACEVMQANCTSEGRLAEVVKGLAHNQSDISQHLLNSRVRKEELVGLTPQEIQSINNIISEYDCGLRESLLEYAKCGQFRILHQRDLFATCGDGPNPVRPFSWLVQEIQNVVRGEMELLSTNISTNASD